MIRPRVIHISLAICVDVFFKIMLINVCEQGKQERVSSVLESERAAQALTCCGYCGYDETETYRVKSECY